MYYIRRGHWPDGDRRYRNLTLDTNLSDEVAAQAQLLLGLRIVVSSWWSISNTALQMETPSNSSGTKPSPILKNVSSEHDIGKGHS